MADCSPEELLIGGPLWTRAAVRELVRMVTGVVMTERGVGKWLRRHGFTPQRPARRAYQQQEKQVRAWLEEEYPAIAARAKTEKALVAWADQCGLRLDTAPPGRSWAPKGRTPVVRVNGKRLRVNVMSAITSYGALWFTVFTGRFTAKVFTGFLDRLAPQAGRKVHVIADRHAVHRSKAVHTWWTENADRVELHLMPGYSPELNPDELLNADIKRHVHASRARSTDDLAHETRRFLRRRQRQPASSAATSTPGTSATRSCRQSNSSGSITSRGDMLDVTIDLLEPITHRADGEHLFDGKAACLDERAGQRVVAENAAYRIGHGLRAAIGDHRRSAVCQLLRDATTVCAHHGCAHGKSFDDGHREYLCGTR
jgi:hypothetical protein